MEAARLAGAAWQEAWDWAWAWAWLRLALHPLVLVLTAVLTVFACGLHLLVPATVEDDVGDALSSSGDMLHSIDRSWTGQVKLGGQLGDLRQRLALAVMQAVARGDHRLSRTLAGKLLSLDCDRGGSGRRHYVSTVADFTPQLHLHVGGYARIAAEGYSTIPYRPNIRNSAPQSHGSLHQAEAETPHAKTCPGRCWAGGAEGPACS